MIDLVPARPWMIEKLELQPAQQVVCREMGRADIEFAIRSGVALAVVNDDNVIALGGIAKRWDGCGIAWGLLSCSVGATMAPIHKIVVRGLGRTHFERVEAHIDAEHAEGVRWIEMLGFEREGRMKKFFKGRDFWLYARTRG